MSPKPYESLDVTAKAERLADMLDTALDEAETKRERNQP